MREGLITLGLQEVSPLAAALRPVLDGALALVCEELLDDDAPEHRRMKAELDGYRRALVKAVDPEEIAATASGCFVLLEAALKSSHGAPAAQRQELASLIALVKDAISVLSGDHDSFSAGLGRTADRFDALLALPNIQQLKDKLLAEVAGLRHLVAERQQQWRFTAAMLESRITVLETQLQTVRQEVMRDPLTGVGNRRRFEHALRAHLDPPRPFVVALFDLDDFKRINDTGGHQLGDRVLQEFAQALERNVRSEDVVARLGGDEFALLATGQTLPQVERRLRAIVATLAQLPSGLEAPAHITTSCGAVELSAGDTPQSVMSRADQALYEAKRLGKNRLATKAPPFIRDLLKR